MNSQGQHELPPDWNWRLQIERRIMRIEFTIRELRGKRTMGEREGWALRDWTMAFAGLSMLLATLSEKIGWTTFGAFLVKLYGPR